MRNKIKSILGLSFQLAKAQFKLRNEGSYLGIFWYFLNPLLLFGLLLAVFSSRLGGDIPNYPLYLLFGIIIFNFFKQTTTKASGSVREHRLAIKSINFPTESLPSSIVLHNLFSHFFEILLFALFLFIFNASLSGLLFYPFILLFFVLFILGLSFMLYAFNFYFTDLSNIWSFFAHLLFFATPIFYSVQEGTTLAFINLFNPMFYFISVAREAVIYSRIPSFWMIFGMAGFSVAVFLLGILVFNKLKGKFAELV